MGGRRTLVDELGPAPVGAELPLEKLVVGRAGLSARIGVVAREARERARRDAKYVEMLRFASECLVACMEEEGADAELAWMLIMEQADKDRAKKAGKWGPLEDLAVDVLAALLIELMEGPGLWAGVDEVFAWSRTVGGEG